MYVGWKSTIYLQGLFNLIRLGGSLSLSLSLSVFNSWGCCEIVLFKCIFSSIYFLFTFYVFLFLLIHDAVLLYRLALIFL